MIRRKRFNPREMLASECPNRIRGLRQARGLMMRELAALADVNLYTLCPLERGTFPVSPDREVRIAAALGVQVHELYREVKEND